MGTPRWTAPFANPASNSRMRLRTPKPLKSENGGAGHRGRPKSDLRRCHRSRKRSEPKRPSVQGAISSRAWTAGVCQGAAIQELFAGIDPLPHSRQSHARGVKVWNAGSPPFWPLTWSATRVSWAQTRRLSNSGASRLMLNGNFGLSSNSLRCEPAAPVQTERRILAARSRPWPSG